MNADAPETPSPALAELARACGVAVEYTAWNGERTPSAVGTIRSVLASLGVDARDDDACMRSLADLDDLTWRRLVPPVTVLVEGEAATIPVHVPHGAPVAASLMLEHGDPRALEQLDVYVPPRMLDGREVGRATFQVPGDLPLGWHRLEAATSGRRGRGWVVVTPARIDVPEHVRRDRPWGLAAQLYSVRSERSWGIGDFGDLADLCALAAIREGADFLLINPLHAAEAVPPLEPSPYLPTSRRFLNPLYIRIEDIPEVAYVPSQHRAVIEWESERPRRANLDADLLDRDAAWRAKSAALEKIFEVERSAARQARFEAFCLREGDALEEFATWCAIGEAHKGLPWPEEFSNPRAREVDAWRDEHGERVLFFAWLQWIADEQLARAQAAAHEAGMGIGIMTDLAVGVHPQGADAWALGRVLATGMEVGAPPDMYNQHGQNWSQPPWQPRALEAAAYMPFRDVVRAAVRHSGALRVDHILGLFRQWWIPAGNRADDGVYVQFDHEALIGILALEAQRAGTIVIGEDLGTLEPWVSDYLNQRGLLGTVVALFEKGADGGPQAPENYRADALVSVTVHDLPPTAPFLAGEHIAAREELGLIVGDAEQARVAAREDRRRLADYLLERGWMPQDWEEDDLVAGVHRMAMHSPALLTAVSLTDAVGDRRSQNHPGTSTEYPNWRIPLTDKSGAVVLLDDIFDNQRLQRLLEAVRTARR